MARGCNYLFLGSITPEGRGQAPTRKAERAAWVANVTGNKNRTSGSRKLQSLQAVSTDSEADNMYERYKQTAGGKEVSLTSTIVQTLSTRAGN